MPFILKYHIHITISEHGGGCGVRALCSKEMSYRQTSMLWVQRDEGLTTNTCSPPLNPLIGLLATIA